MSQESAERTNYESTWTPTTKRLCVVAKGWRLCAASAGSKRGGWSVRLRLSKRQCNEDSCAHLQACDVRCGRVCDSSCKIVSCGSRVFIGQALACALVKIAARRSRVLIGPQHSVRIVLKCPERVCVFSLDRCLRVSNLRLRLRHPPGETIHHLAIIM